jgi:multisubunit Na+/H+ antiporter MnhE subunit
MNKSLFSEFIAFMLLFISWATFNQFLQTLILIVGFITSLYGLYLMRIKHKKDMQKKE